MSTREYIQIIDKFCLNQIKIKDEKLIIEIRDEKKEETSWGWAGPSSDQLLARYTSIEAWLGVYAVTVVNWFRVFFVYQIKLIKPMWTNQFYQSKFNKANCFRSIQVWKIILIQSSSTNQGGQMYFGNIF